jgi:hypothetical protein
MYKTIYLPSKLPIFLPIYLYMRPISYKISYQGIKQILTPLRFIHNWVITDIQWMDIMRDILHGTSLESLLASLPKVAYEKK